MQPRRAAADRRRDARADDRPATCSTSPSASCARGVEANTRDGRHRDRHGSAHRRDPRAGELADVQPNASGAVRRRRAAQPRDAGRLRAGLDVQDRDRVGGASKKACVKPTDLIDCNPGLHHVPGPQADHRHATTTACCRSPTSSSSRATSARSRSGLRVGAERLSRYVHRFGFGAGARPDFPGESAGIVWNPTARLNDSALASVSMGYQVGVTPLQMATAVERGRQRRRARSSRASCARSSATAGATPSRPRSLRRAISAETAATLTTIMEGVVERGTGEGRADRRLHGRRQDRHRAEAGQRPLLDDRVQRVVRRLRAVAQAGAHDPRRHRLAARRRPLRRRRWRRRSSSASPRPRCASSACRRRSIRRRRSSSRATDDARPRRRRCCRRSFRRLTAGRRPHGRCRTCAA